MKQWTPATLANELFEVAKGKGSRFFLEELDASDCVAKSTYDNKTIDSTADPSLCGYIPASIHELLHKHLDFLVRKHFNEALEEDIIEAIERRIIKHIRRHPTVMRKWRRLLRRKILQGMTNEQSATK